LTVILGVEACRNSAFIVFNKKRKSWASIVMVGDSA
jgi:hypothetical protein